MFMKVGQHSSGIPATPALLETVALAHQRLALQVQQTGRTGWYFRVLRKAMLNQTCLILVERPFRSGLLPELITSCTTSSMTELAAELAACPLLHLTGGGRYSTVPLGINLDSQPRLIGANEVGQLPKMPVMFDVQSFGALHGQQLRIWYHSKGHPGGNSD